MKIIGKQESAGGFPCGFLFSGLFPPFPKLWEGGIKGGWVSNYITHSLIQTYSVVQDALRTLIEPSN